MLGINHAKVRTWCAACVAFESISLFRGSPCQARTLVCPRSGYGSRLSRMVRVCVLAFVSGVESSMTCGAVRAGGSVGVAVARMVKPVAMA
jgi:hypothetical protein